MKEWLEKLDPRAVGSSNVECERRLVGEGGREVISSEAPELMSGAKKLRMLVPATSGHGLTPWAAPLETVTNLARLEDSAWLLVCRGEVWCKVGVDVSNPAEVIGGQW